MYLAYATMCIIFGTTFLAIKVGMETGVAPFIFAGSRFLIAGFLVLLFKKYQGQRVILKKAELFDAIFVGTTMTGVLFGSLYWGEQYISSGLAALLAATAPLIVCLVQWWQGGAKLAGKRILGIMLGMVGVGIAVMPSITANSDSRYIIAIGLILVAQISYSFGVVRAKKALQNNLNSQVFNAYQMMCGGLVLMILSAMTEKWSALVINDDVVGAWMYLTILGSIVGHGIYYWLVGVTNPLFPSTWTYISPIIAQFVGYWWLSEKLSWLSFAGLSLVLFGLLFINSDIKAEKAEVANIAGCES